MTVVVLLGAPGAGKGTQADILRKRLGIPHVATGDLFRAAVSQGSAIGLEARRYMERGQLVPDATTIRMVLERLERSDAKDGAILDGFPRTAAQAAALDIALGEGATQVDHALLIEVPSEDLVARLSGRLLCRASGHVYHANANPPAVSGRCDLDGSELIQRDDDRADTIRARLDGQLEALEHVVDHYRSHGVLRTVDGLRPIPDVGEALLAQLGQAAERPA